MTDLLALDSPRPGRTFRRRRLGVLAGVLVLTVAMAPLVGGNDRPVSVAAGASTDDLFVGESASAPVTLAAVFAETTSTLLEATTTTVAPSTTVAPVPSLVETTTDPATTAAPSATTSTSGAPTTTARPAPERSEAKSQPAATSPSTTAAPAPTTAAPTTSAPTTTGAPATTAPAASGGSSYDDPDTLQVWLDLARCEAGGDWSINTGNGYYGGLQFSVGTWESVGGSGYPHEHPRDTQIQMGRRLQARQGWGAWPHCSEELGLR